MLQRYSASEDSWNTAALDALRSDGCVVITDVFSETFLEELRAALYRARDGILSQIGAKRLEKAGELGVVRLPFLFDHAFYRLLEVPEVLKTVDTTVGETSTLHLMNGFVLPSIQDTETPTVFQNTFHRDFPRYLNGYLASVNIFIAIDAFTNENGATLVIPRSHQQAEPPTSSEIAAAAPALAPAGSMLIFDSTLWHAAGKNVSGHDRLALNLQFTRSFIKQQIDYVRALGDASVRALPARSQQLLGWYTRVVTSLAEYYVDEHERLYRRGQG